MLSHQGVPLGKKIRTCGRLGGIVLLGEGFAISEAQVRSGGSLFLLLMDLDIELSASPVPFLLTCCYATHHDDNGLDF